MDYKAWFAKQNKEVQALLEKQFGAQYRALQKERANARQATRLLESGDQAQALADFKEAKNTGGWLESRIHLRFTEIADELFGDGMLTREERIGLSSAIGAGLEAFTNQVASVAPQLYERPPWKPAEDDTRPGRAIEVATPPNENSEEIELVESGQAGHYSPLMEKAVRHDGTIPVKIISPGWGSSGFYPAEVLERDAAVFGKGTKMYWDHPTASEEVERPERSLRDLAAELVSEARWEANGADGPGLYADAKVFEAYQGPVDEMAPHIGVSINALGYGRQGEAEGQKGHIVEQLVHAKSVDFVTEPGRGGQILEMFEAARPQRRDADAGEASLASLPTVHIETKKNIKEKLTMDELQKLQESVDTLTESLAETNAENARLREAQTLREAGDQVSKVLAGIEMPEMTRERLVEQISANPPLTEDKALDVEALSQRIHDAIAREAKYLASLGTAGQITGMGDATPVDELSEAEEAETVETELEESFSSMGLSEAASKAAAAGR